MKLEQLIVFTAIAHSGAQSYLRSDATGNKRNVQVVVDPSQITNQLHQDPRTVEYKEKSNFKNPRKFISYTSSPWEAWWFENIDIWEKSESICDVMKSPDHTRFMYDFLKTTCTNGYLPPNDNWCMVDDLMHPLIFNTANKDKIEYYWEATEFQNIDWTGPAEIKLQPDGEPPKVVNPTPDMEHVFSKFLFLDETTGEQYVEYIEPLVSHLRFPLSKCEGDKNVPFYQLSYYRGLEYRGYVIPPAGVRNKRKLYFDAGASDWSKVSKGSSLQYFYGMWKRQGIDWDHIYAYEMATTSEDFYDTVPDEHKNLVTYQQCAVSSSPQEDSEEHPFLPNEIRRKANPEDYVLFKLDIDSYGIEVGTIENIINDPDNFIDEIAFEHHVSGNYLMRTEWGPGIAKNGEVSLRESYDLFMRMRMKGIRAHSWI